MQQVKNSTYDQAVTIMDCCLNISDATTAMYRKGDEAVTMVHESLQRLEEAKHALYAHAIELGFNVHMPKLDRVWSRLITLEINRCDRQFMRETISRLGVPNAFGQAEEENAKRIQQILNAIVRLDYTAKQYVAKYQRGDLSQTVEDNRRANA